MYAHLIHIQLVFLQAAFAIMDTHGILHLKDVKLLFVRLILLCLKVVNVCAIQDIICKVEFVKKLLLVLPDRLGTLIN
jgi:hypothetical protein